MTPAQHARKIFSTIKVSGIIKYIAGQRQHGGRLWEVPIPELLAAAQEEVLDQGSYLWTMEEQLIDLKKTCYELFDSLEQGEEPLGLEDQQRVENIKALLGE